MTTEEVAHRKELLYYDLLPELQAVPEVLEQIELNWSRNGSRIPLAVVSGGNSRVSDEVARNTGPAGPASTHWSAPSDYTGSKPDPEPFLVAAARLNVAPRDCLVFEDTDMGIQAATAAGMASVKILQPWERS